MRNTFATFLTILLASAGSAQESFTLKFKLDADVGKTTQYRSSHVSTGSMKIYDAEGKLLAEPKKEGDEVVYRTTDLERDKAGKWTKFIRVYEKANEKEDGKLKTFSYEGRTLLFERVGDKFQIGVVGDKPLDGKDAQKLYSKLGKKSESAELRRQLMTGKPVKVGESWKVPVKPVADAMDEMKADIGKSSITAKFVKAYKKGTSQFGTFAIEIRMVIIEATEEGTAAKFDPPALLSTDLTLDLAIDGSSTEYKEGGTMAMKGDCQMLVSGQKIRVVFDMKATGSDENSPEIDDPKARIVPKVTPIPRPGEMVVFTQKEHGFKAKYPGVPEKKTTMSKEGVSTTEYSVLTDGGRVHYAVNVTDYPEKYKIDPLVAYGNLKKNPAYKEWKDIKLGGFAAVELKQEVKNSATFHVKLRIVVIGQRLYQVQATVEEGLKADVDGFLDSFELVAPEKPKVKEK